MAFLDENKYRGILCGANKFKDIQDIADYFLAEYKIYNTDNPRYIEKLSELIQETKRKIDEQRKMLIAKDKKDNYTNPDGSAMEKKDYLEYKFSGEKLGFGLISFPGGSRFSMNKIKDIEKAYNIFTEVAKEEREKQLDPLPQFNFDTDAKIITWLHELGVLNVVLQISKDGEINNFRRAANIIHTFTGINTDTLRKCMNAIYSPGSDQRNNPLKNPVNNIFVSEMCQKFKIRTTK